MSGRTSLVVRAYNEEKHIGRLLSGVMQQSVGEVEIVLVDSGSTDATVAIAKQYPVKVVHIAPDDFTFGRSLNLGISKTSGEFIILASAHVYPVYPDWIERLLAPFADSEIALTYGKQRGAKTTQFSEKQHFQEWFPDQSDLKQGQPYYHNANAAIRRSLWEQNLYDEGLTGLEDIAWSSWAVEEGYRIAYVAEAEVIHVHEETPGQIYNRYRREAIALKQILPESGFTLRYFLSHFARYAFADALAALREGVFLRHISSILRYRFLQYWGTYRGYQHRGPVSERLKQVFYYSPKILGPRRAASRPVEPIDYGEIDGQPGR